MISLCLSSHAADLQAGVNVVDGQRLTAAQLLALVNNGSINTQFYTSKSASATNLQTGDILLLITASGTYHKITGADILNNPQLISSQSLTAALPGYATVAYYDPSNQVLKQIIVTNFASTITSNLVISNLMFFNGTNQVLQSYTNTPNFYATNVPATNQQTYYLVWASNGIPYYLTYSNLLAPIIAPLGTNLLVPYIYTNVFSPFVPYQTNAATNAWGFYTNFPITNLVFTNAAQTNPVTYTLNDSDKIPIAPTAQNSNTTVQLQAVYQYVTNKAFVITNVNVPNAAGQITNVAHGLGTTPHSMLWTMVCITNDNGFTVGQELPTEYVTTKHNDTGFATHMPAFTAGKDSVNVFIGSTIQAETNYFAGNASSGSVATALTKVRWKLKCVAQ